MIFQDEIKMLTKQEIKHFSKQKFLNPKQISYEDLYKIIDEYQTYQIEFELQHEELKRTLLHLQTEEERYFDLFKFIPFGYITLSTKGTIIDANDAAAILTKVDKNVLVNTPFIRYVTPNNKQVLSNYLLKSKQETDLQTFEIQLLQPNAQPLDVQIDFKIQKNTFLKQAWILVFIKDISERKQKEKALISQQRKHADIQQQQFLGELTELIAYEIKNPLTIINKFLDESLNCCCNKEFDATHVIPILKEIVHQSHRITQCIEHAKSFLNKGMLNHETVLMEDIIQEAITLIGYEYSINLCALNYCSKADFYISLDKIQFTQALLNLCRYAIHLMEEASVIFPKLQIEVYQVENTEACLNIITSRTKIDSEQLYSQFNKKEARKLNTELELTISKKIIEAHAGTLTIQPHNEGGICFTINLPCSI